MRSARKESSWNEYTRRYPVGNGSEEARRFPSLHCYTAARFIDELAPQTLSVIAKYEIHIRGQHIPRAAGELVLELSRRPAREAGKQASLARRPFYVFRVHAEVDAWQHRKCCLRLALRAKQRDQDFAHHRPAGVHGLAARLVL